jgi:diguanylate cyclase (GGDEF)-like protein
LVDETRAPRTNRRALGALIVAIALLPVGVGAAVVEHRSKVADQDRALRHEAGAQAEVLKNYFARARSLTQLMSHDASFRRYYEAPASRAQNLQAASSSMSYLEHLFPGSVGESCFIDRGGAENARAVRGRIAPVNTLSPDESGNPFFKPTFALEPGDVYQAKPYVSPDTGEWVISNSTPIPRVRGRKQAIVHFEVTIESFRRAAAESSSRFTISVVDRQSGRVVLDSRFAQASKAPLGRPDDRRFVSLADEARGGGITVPNDRRSGFERLGRSSTNANDWIVVATERHAGASLLQSVGLSQLALLLGALILLGFSIVSLRASQRELRSAALTDPLTGLNNRRRLVFDITRRLAGATPERPFALVLFDLDGFKGYNDAFGHLAGDDLLRRLGHSLSRSIKGRGDAYRMGGDEFCVLADLHDHEAPDAVALAASAALSERGEGFGITASFGSVVLPTEASSATEALRLADQRMYARKSSRRASAERQTTDVLLKVLAERSPSLGAHLDAVSQLCLAVAEKLGLPDDAVTPLLQAASLHDVGQLAIPDEIMSKPGALSEEEWSFVRKHTLIGERILGAAPALARAAKLVRSSHERFDGGGYPDGLAGDAIPLGARIILVCDAYNAITSNRPYRARRDSPAALAELMRCAGTQFDPAVVAAFTEAIEDGTIGPKGPPAEAPAASKNGAREFETVA